MRKNAAKKATTVAKKATAAPVDQALSRSKAPHVLLSYQQDWVRDQADVAFWEKSRRIGASWCDASDSVLTAGAEGGMDAMYIGYSEDMAREYIDDCAMWSRAFNQAAGETREVMFDDTDSDGDIRQIKAFRIDYASGFKVLALSSRPRSIRGKQGKVTIDEAAFHDDLPGLLKAALAMLIWGGRVRVLSSHNGEDNAFNQVVKEIRAGKLPYSIHQTTFTQALDAGLFDRVKLILGKRLKEATREDWEAKVRAQYGEGAAEELDCIPSMGSGVYIPRTLVERAQEKRPAGAELCRVIRLAKPAEWTLDDKRLEEADRWIADVLKPAIDQLPNVRSVLGRDFGRSGDLSIESVLQEVEPLKWRATLTLELRRIPFDVQEKINLYLLDNLPLWHHAKYDARGNGQQLAETALQKFGPARVECVMATPTWYAANFPPYKAALEDRSIELPKGEDEIADHRRVVLKNGYPTMDDGKDKGSDGEQRHGDRAVARVLAWAAARAEGQPPAGESVDPERDAFLPDAMANRRRATMFRRAA
jgi:phage FluMu gp28-like protein